MFLEDFIGPTSPTFLIQASWRIFVAIVLGGMIGYERESTNKPAGFRTTMLFCLGPMLFILIPNLMGMGEEALSRAIQGIGAFIGAVALGTVIKNDDKEIIGLTTAVTAVVTAGIGIAIGVGLIGVAFIVTLATLLVLRLPQPKRG